MKKIYFPVFIFFLCSCEKQRQQVAGFFFDATKFSERRVYRYEFNPDGKMRTEVMLWHIYADGQLLDSITMRKHYEYNEHGKIASISDPDGGSRQFYFYNYVDSLIAEYDIDRFGDTTHMRMIKYDNGLVRRQVDRRFDYFPSPGKVALAHDVIWRVTEYKYAEGKLAVSRELDQHGNLTGEDHYYYEGDQLTDRVTFTFSGGVKSMIHTTTYKPGGMQTDCVTIGVAGDTIYQLETFVQDTIKIVRTWIGEIDVEILDYYDLRGRRIGSVDNSFADGMRRVYSYTYDERGNVIEELSYKEKLRLPG